MGRERLEQARDLIKAKRYQEARQVLKGVDHPTARAWLAKLDEIAPEVPEDDPFAVFDAPAAWPAAPVAAMQKTKAKRRLNRWVALALLVVLIGIAGVAIWYFNYSMRAGSQLLADVMKQQTQLSEMFSKDGLTFRYPTAWEVSEGLDGYNFKPPTAKDAIPDEMVLIFAIRDGRSASQVTTKDCVGVAKEEGFALPNGVVVIRPGGIVDEPQSTTAAGLTGVACGYRSENTVMRSTYLDVSKGVIVAISGYSKNAASFDPIYNAMLGSMKLDTAKLDSWKRLGAPPPTPPQ